MRVLLLMLAAAACAPKPAIDAPAPAEACDAAPVQSLVGLPVAAVRADAQQRSGAATLRIYHSGDAVTMDYRPDRLNIETDAADRIVKLSCG